MYFCSCNNIRIPSTSDHDSSLPYLYNGSRDKNYPSPKVKLLEIFLLKGDKIIVSVIRYQRNSVPSTVSYETSFGWHAWNFNSHEAPFFVFYVEVEDFPM